MSISSDLSSPRGAEEGADVIALDIFAELGRIDRRADSNSIRA
jgi:hypothetical protein